MSQEIVFASVTLKSHSGVSIHQLADRRKLSADSIAQFRPKHNHVEKVRERLAAAGFKIEAVTDVGIAISGPRQLFETELETKLSKRTLTLERAHGEKRHAEHYVADKPLLMSHRIKEWAEAITLSVPGVPCYGATPPTPSSAYYYLNVLTDVPALLNATPLQGTPVDGTGVLVCMVDTGIVNRVTEQITASQVGQLSVGHPMRSVVGVFLSSDTAHSGTNYFTNGELAGGTVVLGTPLPAPGTQVDLVYSTFHPHFLSQSYNLSTPPAPSGLDVERDEVGHGTAMAANILAIAPKAALSSVKYTDGVISAPVQAFQLAVQHLQTQPAGPKIIVCGWVLAAPDPTLDAAIASAVASGIVVICPAGNGETDMGGSAVSIAQPDMISVGGAYPINGGGFKASSYASSYDSAIYLNPQRHCPDVTGLVGEAPKGVLIMLPTEPGSQMDTELAVAYPNGDATAADDGWCVTSGTSAAAAQVAGVAALLLTKYPTLSPAAVKNILQNSARDITTGLSKSTPPQMARVGWDQATGFGLVDANAAVNYLQNGQLDLFIRDSIEDHGGTSLAQYLWTSPDIIVFNAPLTDTAEIGAVVKYRGDLNEAVERGQSNYIYLRVQNRGTVTAAAEAKVFGIDPATFSNPSTWTQLGILSGGVIPPFPIGAIPPGEFRVVGPIEWPSTQVPTLSHYCLIALLNHAQDPQPNYTSVTTVSQFETMVRTHNNIAWRNVEVHDILAKSLVHYEFYVQMPPVDPGDPELHLDLREFMPDAITAVRISRKAVDGATLNGFTIAGQSALYTTLAHTGGLATIKGLHIDKGQRVQVRVSYTAPSEIADGDFVARATLFMNAVNLGGYTHVARYSKASYVGNRRSLELHRSGCPWTLRMSPYNKVPYADVNRPHALGYDNCALCLGGSLR